MDSELAYAASKLVWTIASPGNWPIYGSIGATIALWGGRPIAARRLSAIVALYMVFAATGLIRNLLLAPLEQAYPANPTLTHVDGLIVLGGAEEPATSHRWGQPLVNAAADRFLATIALARKFPNARILVSGASDPVGAVLNGPQSLSSQILERAGIRRDRLIVEPQSRNTRENARLGLVLVQPQEGQTWVLITSAFHMSRAMFDFSGAGWPPVIAYPTDFRTSGVVLQPEWSLSSNLSDIELATKEIVALALKPLRK